MTGLSVALNREDMELPIKRKTASGNFRSAYGIFTRMHPARSQSTDPCASFLSENTQIPPGAARVPTFRQKTRRLGRNAPFARSRSVT